MKNKPSFWYRNSLSLTLLAIFLLLWVGQAYTGWHANNEDLQERGQALLSFGDYLQSGHFVSATFENWESEFLQMFIYILFTMFLRQKGSAESKSLDEPEEVDRPPKPSPKAPWPVNRGGFWLWFYKRSLSFTFLALFLFSISFHALGSYRNYVQQERMENRMPEPLQHYLLDSKFWFESLQNWQSEFLAVLTLVVFTIFLRQYGSPQSKPVDAPDSQTGE